MISRSYRYEDGLVIEPNFFHPGQMISWSNKYSNHTLRDECRETIQEYSQTYGEGPFEVVSNGIGDEGYIPGQVIINTKLGLKTFSQTWFCLTEMVK